MVSDSGIIRLRLIQNYKAALMFTSIFPFPAAFFWTEQFFSTSLIFVMNRRRVDFANYFQSNIFPQECDSLAVEHKNLSRCFSFELFERRSSDVWCDARFWWRRRTRRNRRVTSQTSQGSETRWNTSNIKSFESIRSTFNKSFEFSPKLSFNYYRHC